MIFTRFRFKVYSRHFDRVFNHFRVSNYRNRTYRRDLNYFRTCHRKYTQDFAGEFRVSFVSAGAWLFLSRIRRDKLFIALCILRNVILSSKGAVPTYNRAMVNMYPRRADLYLCVNILFAKLRVKGSKGNNVNVMGNLMMAAPRHGRHAIVKKCLIICGIVKATRMNVSRVLTPRIGRCPNITAQIILWQTMNAN